MTIITKAPTRVGRRSLALARKGASAAPSKPPVPLRVTLGHGRDQ